MTHKLEARARIALLLADVDGTLVTEDKVLTERARAAVHRLRETGIRFAITSGRPPRGMAMLIEPLALDTPIAAFNGAVFVNPDMSIIRELRIAASAASRAVEVMLAHGLDAWVYSGSDWLVRDESAPHVARERWTVKFGPTVVAHFGEALERAAKSARPRSSASATIMPWCSAARRSCKRNWAPPPRSLARSPTTWM